MRRHLAFVSTVALAAACSPSANNSGSGPSSTDVANAYFNVICQLNTTCVGGAQYLDDSCLAQLAPAGADLATAVSAGRVNLDGSSSQACLDALNAFTCSAAAAAGTADPLAPCKNIFTGTIGAGGACYSGNDCVSLICDQSNLQCPGKCKAQSSRGGACGGSGDCDQSAGETVCANGKCAAATAEGGSCTSSAACSGTTVCTGGKCSSTGGGRGAACLAGFECTTGFYCLQAFDMGGNPQPGTCAAQAAAGATCGDDTAHLQAQVQSQCAGVSACKGLTIDQTARKLTPGKCAPMVDVGGDCVSVTAPQTAITGCRLGLVCVSGKCQIAPSSGPCANDFFTPCRSDAATCDATNKCAPLKADGATCTTAGDCKSGNCSATGACAAPPVCHEM